MDQTAGIECRYMGAEYGPETKKVKGQGAILHLEWYRTRE